MFCNQCGKDNKEGTKFCTQCGNPLNVAPQNTSNQNATSTYKNDNVFSKISSKKPLIMFLTVAILVLIAAINIIRPYTRLENIKVYNDEQIASSNRNIYETKSCIYYVNDGLIRVDKMTQTAKKVSNKDVNIFSATDDGVYCVNYENHAVYKMMDKSSELKRATEIQDWYGDNFYLNGRYNYTLEYDGTLTRRLNSEKYAGIFVVLNEGSSDYSVSTAKMYKDYLYVTMSDDSLESNSGYRFSRISLNTGKEEKLLDDEVISFEITGNSIVYNVANDGMYVMNLDGGNQRELVELDGGEYYSSFFCYDNYIFFNKSYNDLCRYNIDGSGETELDVKSTYLKGINNQLAYVSDKTLYLLDYDGNVTAEIKP